MAPDLLGRACAEIMTPAPKTIGPQALAAEALGRMNQSAITSLVVVEAGTVVGLLHLHDLLRAGVV
jgi:arabinose-5-phosphate isomerase